MLKHCSCFHRFWLCVALIYNDLIGYKIFEVGNRVFQRSKIWVKMKFFGVLF